MQRRLADRLMCGRDRCIYYGCDACCRRLTGDILQVTREECDCLNDVYAEFCTPSCFADYKTWVPCECGAHNPWYTRYGPSQK